MAQGSGLISPASGGSAVPTDGDFALTDVGVNGDGSFQRGKDPKIDGGTLGGGLVPSPVDMSGSGLPSPGDPIMAISQNLTETPNSMSGMPLGIEGEVLGPGDPGPNGSVEFEDLGAAAGSGRTVPGRELENFGKTTNGR